MTGLFRSVMGDDFANLSPAVARFHDTGPGACARGSLRVRRGQGLLSKCMGWLMGVPAAADAIPVTLDVLAGSRGEHWSRRFGDRPFESQMWEHQGMLVEAIGPAHIAFRLRADAGDLVFDTASCRVLGIPLPSFLWPRIQVRASASESEPESLDRFGILVVLSMPLVGLIFEYSGEIKQIQSGNSADGDEKDKS